MANDDVGDEEEVCMVFSTEDKFTSFVQFMLACFALLSLYFKRQQEYPRRKFKTWSLDVSKQGIGAVYAHILNMVIAAVIAENVRGNMELEDQCAWYAINYTIDSTVGLLISIFFLRLLDYVANKRGWLALKDSGVYYGDDAVLHWFVQLIAWLIVLSIVKIIICYFMWLSSEFLAHVGQIFFAPLQANIRAELLFVMIFFPGILNVMYFWIIDSYLKADKNSQHAHEVDEVAEETYAAENHYNEFPDTSSSNGNNTATMPIGGYNCPILPTPLPHTGV